MTDKNMTTPVSTSDKKFVIVTGTYPTSSCKSQSRFICPTDVEVSKLSYDSRQQAIKEAREIRDKHCALGDGRQCNENERLSNLPDLKNRDDNDYETKVAIMTEEDYVMCIEELRVYEEFEGKVKAGVLSEQVKASGVNVFYSFSARSNYDIPAELDFDDSVYALPEGIKGKEDLWPIKSLRFTGSDESWSYSLEYWRQERKEEEGEGPIDLLLWILPHCTSLQELHLKQRIGGSLSSGYIERILQVAPHLANTLKVLSFPFIHVDPEALKSITGFTHLEHLDMWNSMTFEHYDFGNVCEMDDSDKGEFEKELPYDQSLATCVARLKNLTRLDLGFGGPGEQRGMHEYVLSATVLCLISFDLEERGGTVTMKETRSPPDFPNKELSDAAVKSVLSALSLNKEEKPEIRELAIEELKSLETCTPQKNKKRRK